MYSPPTTPQIDPDIREDLLRHLDREIQATQVRHDEAQRRLQCERRHATTHEPFKNAEEQANPRVIQQFQQDYSFNLTGIIPPQPPKWKQVDHLYEDFKKFQRSCTRVFDGPMAHVLEKVKVNMLLLWCGLDVEDIYDLTYPYINSMMWISFGPCLTSTVNPSVILCCKMEIQDCCPGSI